MKACLPSNQCTVPENTKLLLQGLFDTLAAKFKPQFNETIKSLQFRKLHRFKGKSTEEWMGRLGIAVAECNYKEIDRQLKEQFIHGLNDKAMLDEVVRELTAKNSSKQMNCEDVLLWEGKSRHRGHKQLY